MVKKRSSLRKIVKKRSLSRKKRRQSRPRSINKRDSYRLNSTSISRKKMIGGDGDRPETTQKLKDAIESLTSSLKATLGQCQQDSGTPAVGGRRPVYYGGHYLNKFLSRKK